MKHFVNGNIFLGLNSTENTFALPTRIASNAVLYGHDINLEKEDPQRRDYAHNSMDEAAAVINKKKINDNVCWKGG